MEKTKLKLVGIAVDLPVAAALGKVWLSPSMPLYVIIAGLVGRFFFPSKVLRCAVSTFHAAISQSGKLHLGTCYVYILKTEVAPRLGKPHVSR